MGKAYIKSKIARASCDLGDHLDSLGVLTSGVGYESPRGKKLFVYLVKKSDAAKVPGEYAGYSVEWRYTGVFKAGGAQP